MSNFIAHWHLKEQKDAVLKYFRSVNFSPLLPPLSFSPRLTQRTQLIRPAHPEDKGFRWTVARNSCREDSQCRMDLGADNDSELP